MAEHVGVTSGDGLSVDIFRKKGPAGIEDADYLAISVHVPLYMIAELQLPPDEPATGTPP